MAQILTNHPQAGQALQRKLPISQGISQALGKASRPVPVGGHIEGAEMLEKQEQLTYKEAQVEDTDPLNLSPEDTVGIRF